MHSKSDNYSAKFTQIYIDVSTRPPKLYSEIYYHCLSEKDIPSCQTCLPAINPCLLAIEDVLYFQALMAYRLIFRFKSVSFIDFDR